jgi:TRAP-type mannitol/chloroaromatic compound transport system permease large subunit
MSHTITPGNSRSALKQLPGWLATSLLATAIVCTTWAWATGDAAAGLIGTGSLILSVIVALAIDRAAGHQPSTKENHA